MNTSEKIHPTTKKPPTVPTTTTTTKPAATKTTTTTATATATVPLKPPPAKNQQFQPAPRYRPRPPPTRRDDLDLRHRRRRQCCTCKCFFLTILWIILITIAFLVLAAVTAAVFYAVYHPQPPSFTLSSLKISQFNLTSPTQFNAHTKFNISLTTTNPNHQIKFYYNPINLTLFTHQNIELGKGEFPSFVHSNINSKTTLFTTITNNKDGIDDATFGKLQNEMKQKNGRIIVNLLVKIETKLKVKIGDKVNFNNIGLRVFCDGIKIHGSKNNGKFSVEIVNEKCNVHFFYIILNDWEIPI